MLANADIELADVWRWAGNCRNEDLNIGVEFWRVSMTVRDLVLDAKLWFAENSIMTTDLAGTRFHLRLVQIHPFPNGNGRHSRQLTDLALFAMCAAPFTWGSNDLGPISDVRRTFTKALQAADHGQHDDLCAYLAPAPDRLPANTGHPEPGVVSRRVAQGPSAGSG